MRLLTDAPGGALRGALDDEGLRRVYATPAERWLRVNMVSTLDGAATGSGGVTGSINNPADKRVFDLLRSLADAVVVGAGTARREGYGPTGVPLVVVTRRGDVPERLQGVRDGRVLLVTCTAAPGLAASRESLGAENVLVLGEETVDLSALRNALEDRGLRRLLCEGGPHLLADLLEVGQVDELCMTVVPMLVAGAHPRITAGPEVDVPLELTALLEEDGTLLGRWLVRRPAGQA